jgi:hypothetical protein
MPARRGARVLGLAAALLGACAVAQEPRSGLAVGAPTASIPVVDVTGPYKGQRICYVCEFQDDPNVLAFFRDTSPETGALIVALNELYLANRDKNFKAVAMIVAGSESAGWLEELSRSAGIEVPLTFFRKGPADVAARLYEINPDVANTFLVTKNRYVTANLADIGPDQFGQVAAAAERTLASGAP